MTTNTPETVAGGNPDKPWEWKPGQSGNPNGRPRDQFSFMGILRSVLAEENSSGKSTGERIIRRYVKLALAGNPQAAEALMARIDGKPAQSLTISGNDDAPLHVRHSARLEVTPAARLQVPEVPPTPVDDVVDVEGLTQAYVSPGAQLPAAEQDQDAAGGEVYEFPGLNEDGTLPTITESDDPDSDTNTE